jgi:hypothetical protein
MDDGLASPVPPAPDSSGRGDFIPAYRLPPCGPDPRWIERLKRKQEAIQQLSRGLHAHLSAQRPEGVADICAAIEFLLGSEIAEQLERIAHAEAVPRQVPTLEDMERAQRDVEQCQATLEALDELPEGSGEFLAQYTRPQLEGNLKRAQGWLSEIQRAMEAA